MTKKETHLVSGKLVQITKTFGEREFEVILTSDGGIRVGKLSNVQHQTK